jgi:hypothetical protein
MSTETGRDAPSVHVRALVSGLPEPRRSKRLVLVLQAFCDESKRHDSHLYVMAGYISAVAKWERFSDEWQKVLDLAPAIRSLKMSEAMRLRGQLRDEKIRDEHSACSQT